MDIVQGILKRLGYLFYIVDPSSNFFETENDIPDYVADVFPIFLTFLFLEHLFLYKIRGKGIPLLQDTLTSISSGICYQIKGVAVKSLAVYLYINIYEKYSIYRLPWDSTYTWIFTVFMFDFAYYWGHRAAHEINLFWSQHQVHHSSEEYNCTTAVRQAVFQEETLSLFFLPMALFIPPTQFIIHGKFNMLYQFWIHTEVIGRLGPLEWILNTPSHHRVHHGIDRYCLDKNYAGVFIIWDRMFGTFEPEQLNEKITYGLVDQPRSFNPFYLQTFYFGRVLQKTYAMPGIGNKLRVLFYGPGWRPGTRRLGNYHELKEKVIRKKFVKKPSWKMQLYSTIHVSILIFFLDRIIRCQNEMNSLMFYSSCLYVLVSLLSLGLLYDEKLLWLFFWLEMTRFLLFLGYSRQVFYQPDSVVSAILWIIRIIFLYSIWINVLLCFKTFKRG